MGEWFVRWYGERILQIVLVSTCLAALGEIAIREYRRSVWACSSFEAADVLQGIRAAEEAYRSESGAYLGCDARGGHVRGGDLERLPLFPREEAYLTAQTVAWGPTVMGWSPGDCWGLLNVRTNGPVRCGYAVAATGASPGGLPGYVARAVCIDVEGRRAEYRISSETNELVTLDAPDD